MSIRRRHGVMGATIGLAACNALTGADDIVVGPAASTGTDAGVGTGQGGSGNAGTGTITGAGTGQGGSGTAAAGGAAAGTPTAAGGQGGGATSCEDGAVCSGPTGAGGACSVALAQRPTTATVALAGSTAGAVWLAPEPGGCAKAAWVSGGQVHVTPLSGTGDRFGADAVVTGSEVRGLVAHDIGSGVLVRRDDRMVLVGICGDGNTRFAVSIVGGNSHTQDGDKWIDSWPHEGRLGWSGSTYGAYFGHTQNWGTQGNHQGDWLGYFDAGGAAAGVGWSWGCSHSLDVRLAHDGTTFGPVCLSDCYPGKGIYYDHNTLVSSEPSGNCLGSSSARLGGLAAVSGGFWLTYSSEEGRSSFDIALVHISSGGTVGSPIWLTNTAGTDERTSFLARYGANLLVAWLEGSSLVAEVVTTSGAVVDGPATLAVAAPSTDFVNHANGDVGWAYGGGSQLTVVRLPYCQ